MNKAHLFFAAGIIVLLFVTFNIAHKNNPIDMEPVTSHYSLPLEISEISNNDTFSRTIDLNKDSIKLLEKNGFIVVKNPFNSKEESVISAYSDIEKNEIPVFVTADSMLQIYHIQFDEILKNIEEEKLYDILWEIDLKLLQYSIEDYENSSGIMKEAARKNVAYFSVALALLEPDVEQIFRENNSNNDTVKNRSVPIDKMHLFTSSQGDKYSFNIPDCVEQDVKIELDKINDGQVSKSVVFNYNVDYSQYTPRGHYIRSERLKNYFRAMMWHCRMTMVLNSNHLESENSEEEARIQTLSAALISLHMKNDNQLMTEWEKINGVTSFMVGTSEDLGPYEYIDVLNTTMKEKQTLDGLNLTDFKMKLENYDNTGLSGHLIKIDNKSVSTETIPLGKGFRLFGQRYVIDSHIFQNLVYPNVPNRYMPKSLDLMATLGSERAFEHLKSQGDLSNPSYASNLNKLKNEMESYDESDWNSSIYLSWLHCISYLFKDYGPEYPAFMQTEAWHDKELNTALCSWVQLRHDTILYTKQSYTATGLKSVNEKEKAQGYVEPVPEFYDKLSSLTLTTSDNLEKMDCLDANSKNRLDKLAIILRKLETISQKELDNEMLTEEEYQFIANFDQELEQTTINIDANTQKSTLIADVHTDLHDTRNQSILEEGTGYVDLLIVAYQTPSGDVVLSAGPVIEYYEFTHPMPNRLTDEEWRIMLESNPPEKPGWYSYFFTNI